MVSSALARFKFIGMLEGASFLILLLIGMPLKYIAKMPEAVYITGSLHGFLFVVYIIALLLAWNKEKWPFKTAFFAGAASVLPLGPFVFDRWLEKQKA